MEPEDPAGGLLLSKAPPGLHCSRRAPHPAAKCHQSSLTVETGGTGNPIPDDLGVTETSLPAPVPLEWTLHSQDGKASATPTRPGENWSLGR